MHTHVHNSKHMSVENTIGVVTTRKCARVVPVISPIMPNVVVTALRIATLSAVLADIIKR